MSCGRMRGFTPRTRCEIPYEGISSAHYLIPQRCSFRRGERNRKPPGGSSTLFFDSIHFTSAWGHGANTVAPRRDERCDSPGPRRYHTFAVSGCIMDVSVAQDCLNETASGGGNPSQSRRTPSMEALVQPPLLTGVTIFLAPFPASRRFLPSAVTPARRAKAMPSQENGRSPCSRWS